MYENYSLVHENILKFYGAEKRFSDNGMVQYWIVTQYHSNGSLSDYLRANVLDWDTMIQLMISMVKGLAFLHIENLSFNPIKPVISHRDFKSRNVLVKDDLTCCISDFGSACQFSDITESEDIKAQVSEVICYFWIPSVPSPFILIENMREIKLMLHLTLSISNSQGSKKFVRHREKFEIEGSLDRVLFRFCHLDFLITNLLSNFIIRLVLKDTWRLR